MLGKKKYFTTIKRGEISEWRKELLSNKEGIRKEAVKKIVAAMTSGKDLGMLFTEVINCSQTSNVELKKLVYLYMMTYAPQNSELAILSVSSLVKDISHQNSLIRGLALRTMSSIEVDELLEYLTDPLKKCLKDEDPYVRKIACISVAKYFTRSPEQAIGNGLIEDLEELLGDGNTFVVSNAVIALIEIASVSNKIDLTFSQKTIRMLLNALPECNEWGQVYILECMSLYDTADDLTLEKVIIDGVYPFLQSSNVTVLMNTVKLLLRIIEVQVKRNYLNLRNSVLLKIRNPLLTMITSKQSYEIKFVLLKTVSIVVDQFPDIFVCQHEENTEKESTTTNDTKTPEEDEDDEEEPKKSGKKKKKMRNPIKLFFCEYDDPLYIKFVKLKLLEKLLSKSHLEIALMELRGYVNSINIPFVKEVIGTIGRIAVKFYKEGDFIDKSLIPVLINIIETKISYAVQASVNVLFSLLRMEKGSKTRYKEIIIVICEHLGVLEDNNSKVGMLYILSENYGKLIDEKTCLDVIQVFVDHFKEQTQTVQLQLLNSFMKIYLEYHDENESDGKLKEMFETILNLSINLENDHPDLRDKAFFYYRMIKMKVAKKIVLESSATHSGIVFKDWNINKEGNFKEIENLNSISSIIRKNPNILIPNYQKIEISGLEEEGDTEEEEEGEEEEEESENIEEETKMSKPNVEKVVETPPKTQPVVVKDLLSFE